MKPNYRRCVACRQVAPKESFWRVVRVYHNHQVQLDQGVGRSAYLCPDIECLKAAQKKRLLRRSLKVAIPESIYRRLWDRLRSCATDSLLTGSSTTPITNNTLK